MAGYDTEYFQGRKVVASIGPRTAELVLVTDSPDFYAVQNEQPLVGSAGRVLDVALQAAAIDRRDCRIISLVPIRAPKDDFALHSAEALEWGLQRFWAELNSLQPKMVIALGLEPLVELLGPFTGRGSGHGINQWRGSILHPEYWPCVSDGVAQRIGGIVSRPWPVLATLRPADVQKQFAWMSWLKLDMRKASKYLDGRWEFPPDREWVINKPERFGEFVDEIITHSHLVAYDSEMEPLPIVAFATEWAVHAFVVDARVRTHMERLMASPSVLKIAHNWAHDLIWTEKRLDVGVNWPLFDTMGVMHNLEPEGQKALSPHMSTKFTSWPYHKWMFNVDAVTYCAMDAAVCMDAYWPMLGDVFALGDDFQDLVEHDQKLNWHLIDMQSRGVAVDVVEQATVQRELADDYVEAQASFEAMSAPIVEKSYHRFKKPHLFKQAKRCECCGGGKIQSQHCWRCGGLPAKPAKKEDYNYECVTAWLSDKWTVTQAKDQLPVCDTCGGMAKIEAWLPLNLSSSPQMQDLLYRGLAIRPRKFKGKDTLRLEQIEPLTEKYPLVAEYIRCSKIFNEYQTVARLKPGPDGRLHSVLDPWGTVSGRVASKEGLIEVGTNLMNIPYAGRRFIVPDAGEFFLYPDMDQIEARCMAVLSHDPKLNEIFSRDTDFHTEVMEMILEETGFDFNSIDVGPHAGQGRFFSKKTSYAKFYGARANQLAKELGVDEWTAIRIIDAYDKTFVGVPIYHDSVSSQMARDRTWRSPTARFRRFLDRIIDKETGGVHYEYLKKGWSGPPQDMAAFVLAKGLFRLRDEARGLLTPLVHVHDALLISARLVDKAEAVATVRECLTITEWDMQFSSGVSVGPNWFVASLDDNDKIEKGYDEWTLENFLAQ